MKKSWSELGPEQRRQIRLASADNCQLTSGLKKKGNWWRSPHGPGRWLVYDGWRGCLCNHHRNTSAFINLLYASVMSALVVMFSSEELLYA